VNLPAVREQRLVDAHGRELRDPRGATGRIGWTAPDMPMVNEWDAEQAFRLGYLANVIAYRCVQILARNASTPPLVAGRNPRRPTDINENAAITRLLGPPPGGPAPKLSARKLLRWTFAQQLVTGRRAWEIETNDAKVPVAFWPLVAARLCGVPTSGGAEWFKLFEYGTGVNPVKFKPDEVFFGWEPAGTDFRQSESPFQSARYDLSLVTMCDRYGLSFLRNNAVPAAVVTTTQFPDDKLRRQFRSQWQTEFGGVDNAGRTHFHEVSDDGDGPVSEAIDVKVLGLSAKDARLIEQRKEAMAEIAIAIGVPWSKLDASGRTFDNADVEDRTMWEETILPLMTDLVDDINMQLAPRLGPEVVWFDLSGVRALQRKILPVTQTATAPALLTARIMQINEARADYGLQAIADGDRFLSDDELVLFKGSGANPADAAAVREALQQLEQRTAQLETPPEPPALPPAAPPERRAADPGAVEARRAKIWNASNAVVTGLESRWERAWRRLFARQEEAALSRLTGKRGRQALGYGADGRPLETRDAAAPIDPEEIFSLAFWVALSADESTGLYEDVVSAGLSNLALSFGISFDLAAPFVEAFIRSRAQQLAGFVTQTTYDAIRDELVAGVAVGESIDDLATRVRSVFATASKTRAVTIARTEVISAYNGAAMLGAAQMPADVVAAAEWIATRDARTRDAHAAADGQTVAVGTAFDVGGRQMAYPGDPNGGAKNTVNCRCTVAFLTPEEWQAMERARPTIEVRHAKALLGLVPVAPEFDLLGFRRVLEGVAA